MQRRAMSRVLQRHRRPSLGWVFKFKTCEHLVDDGYHDAVQHQLCKAMSCSRLVPLNAPVLPLPLRCVCVLHRGEA